MVVIGVEAFSYERGTPACLGNYGGLGGRGRFFMSEVPLYVQGTMVPLGGGTFSYERSTPVLSSRHGGERARGVGTGVPRS